MDNEQIIKQLESIAENSKSFITKDSDPIWEKDIQAINAAIKIIENENTDISKNEEVYQKAIKTYGLTTQVDMVFEEMSELQKELCKWKRGENTITNIAEEIADVIIMLEQMQLAFNIKKEVEIQKEFKIKRLKERLNIYIERRIQNRLYSSFKVIR